MHLLDLGLLIYFSMYIIQDKEKESKNSSSALKKSGRYRSRSLSASSSDSYSSGMYSSLNHMIFIAVI